MQFDTNTPFSYNFGVTTLGGGQNLQLTNIGIYMGRGSQTTASFEVSIYGGLGGTGTMLTNFSVAATNIPNSGQPLFNLLFGRPLTLTNGNYSMMLTTSTSAGGSSSYNLRQGVLTVLSSSNTPLPLTYWVQDTNATGSAGTNFQAAFVLADYMLNTNSINYGNYRVGQTLSTALTLTNNAIYATNGTNGIVSENLSTSSSLAGAATVASLNTNWLGVNKTTNFNVGMSSANAGSNSGVVTFTYSSISNGTASVRVASLGTNPVGLGIQSVTVSGVGYRLAADALSASNVSLGNYRLGASNVTAGVSITNTAVADAYSEGLGVSSNGVTGGATLANVPGSLIAAGGTNGVTVGLSSVSAAGTNSGSVTLGFNSSGVGTSGLSPTNIGTKVINVSAVGYRLAQDALSATSVNLGNFHLGAANVTAGLTITNTAVADAYSEGLGVSSNGVTGGATLANVPGSLIAAGGTSGVTVGLASVSSAGTNSGTVTLGFNSSGVGTSGLAPTNIGTQAINVSAVGYRLAAQGSGTGYDLGKIHEGGTFGAQTLNVTNSAAASAYTETLAAAFGSATGSASGSGSVSGLAGGSSSSAMSVNITDNTAGSKSGTIGVSFTSQEVNSSGLGNTALSGSSVSVTGFVYTGRASWNVNSGSSWNSFANWDTAGGTPGLAGALSTNDTATFAAGPSGATTVSLNGASPVLTVLNFNNESASYTVAPGSGGSITMGTSYSAASITNAAGSHAISSGLILGRTTAIGTAAGTSLVLGGSLSGSAALNKVGDGLLNITGTGSFSGNTTVSGGTLKVNGSIADSAVTVSGTGTLGGNGTVGSTGIQSGGTVSPGNSPGLLNISGDITWFSGGNYNWQVLGTTNSEAFAAGTTWDLIAATGQLDLSNLSASHRFNINLWSLAQTGPDIDGLISDFNPSQHYTWTLVSAAGGVTGYTGTDQFSIYTSGNNGASGFANPFTGSFSVVASGNDLNLVYTATAVPEPGTWAAAALLAGGAAFLHRRKRAK